MYCGALLLAKMVSVFPFFETQMKNRLGLYFQQTGKLKYWSERGKNVKMRKSTLKAMLSQTQHVLSPRYFPNCQYPKTPKNAAEMQPYKVAGEQNKKDHGLMIHCGPAWQAEMTPLKDTRWLPSLKIYLNLGYNPISRVFPSFCSLPNGGRCMNVITLQFIMKSVSHWKYMLGLTFYCFSSCTVCFIGLRVIFLSGKEL